MEEGELEKEFSDLFREAGYTVSMQALKEIKLCTFSIANFSRYKISDKPGRLVKYDWFRPRMVWHYVLCWGER